MVQAFLKRRHKRVVANQPLADGACALAQGPGLLWLPHVAVLDSEIMKRDSQLFLI